MMLGLNIARSLGRLKIIHGFHIMNNSMIRCSQQTPTHKLCSAYLSTRFDINKDNVILMGSPGCGKTTVGGILSKKLGTDFVDVDDYLETYWNMPVAEKLSHLGSEGFMAAEGEGLQRLSVSKSVIALSGSNPMHSSSMDHIGKTGLIVYLDVQNSDIMRRLEKMKTDRIVGQEVGTPMQEILQHRKQFYEVNYDIRIICGAHESAESIAQKVFEGVEQLSEKEGYVSTRADLNHAIQKSFNEVILEGLASDGGLYVPAGAMPHLTKDQWTRLVPLTLAERAQRILEQWLSPFDLHPSTLSTMVNAVYSDMTFPVQKLHKDLQYSTEYILELFHGPTASFKDAALQITPKLFDHAMKKTDSKHKYLILVATSGDTGGAVLDGFSKLEGGNVGVLVLYPNEGLSSIQKAQMTSVKAPNVKVIGVSSDFDYCQTSIKTIFNDKKIEKELLEKYNCKLSAANSINWGRLLPQVVYHASGYLDLVKHKQIFMGQEVDLCIPTGNFGNILAAYYAKQMGIPFRYLICASNMNNVLTEFFNTGHYSMRSRHVHRTSSSAIDILKSSNLERFLYHVLNRDNIQVRHCYQMLDTEGHFHITKQDLRKIKELILADWCLESSIGPCIYDTYKKTGYLMDPHTAVAKVVAGKFHDDNVPMIIVSTAHYLKFAPMMLNYLGSPVTTLTDFSSMIRDLEALSPRPGSHEMLKRSLFRPTVHNTVIEPNINTVKSEIENFLKFL